MTPIEQRWCLGYGSAGKELTISTELTERGIGHECPAVTVQRIERRAGARRATKVTETVPVLPNYIFLHLTDTTWHDLVDNPIKHLRPTFHFLTRKDVEGMQRFVEDIRNNEVIKEFEVGDQVKVLSGYLSEQVLTFRRLIENGERFQLEADVELFGKTVKGVFDAADVVRVASSG